MNLNNNKTELKLDNAFDPVEIQNTTDQFTTTNDLNITFEEFLHPNPVQESYCQSQKDALLPFWDTLYELFCKLYWGTSNIHVEYVPYDNNPDLQKSGIDRIITFQNGQRLHMEEKYCNRTHPRMFVEVYDSSDQFNDKKGWFYTINNNLCNYIVYGYKQTQTFYFIPFKVFQEIFMPIFEGYDCPYELHDGKRKTGNRTRGWLVPWEDIQRKIEGFVCIQL